ncbi:Hypothetical predicted protein [Mytilus galloprovincialis]|uniref:Uncharacterized protein n=1 Tax=Mytilus galloprovincialis TaxID=29158 RepID=A0A8B6CXJ4_MYTGA|nr:Hypothetical predicted protein [Mytilus galloprovincialis]
MNQIIVVLLFCILDCIFSCTNCPEHQSQNVKSDLCRKNEDGQYNTNVFQGTILEVKEMIPNPDSIMETSDQLDAIQVYYVVEITKVYKVKIQKLMKVQMYAAVTKELCDNMMTELEGMLRTQLALKHTPINVEKHKEPPPDSTVPLIVMCFNASRLGSDVNYAIDNIDLQIFKAMASASITTWIKYPKIWTGVTFGIDVESRANILNSHVLLMEFGIIR